MTLRQLLTPANAWPERRHETGHLDRVRLRYALARLRYDHDRMVRRAGAPFLPVFAAAAQIAVAMQAAVDEVSRVMATTGTSAADLRDQIIANPEETP